MLPQPSHLNLVHIAIVLFLLDLEIRNLSGLLVDLGSVCLQRRLSRLVQPSQLGQ